MSFFYSNNSLISCIKNLFVWDTITRNWTAVGSTYTWAYSKGNITWPASGTTNTAIFNGPAGIVPIQSTGVAANSLQFLVSNYIISGGTLTLNGTTPTINTVGDATISATINGTSGLNKVGAGTLILSGTNSYTGNSSVSAGTLQFGNGGTGGTVPSGNISLSQTGNVAFNYSNNRTINNTFTLTSDSSIGGILKSGTGTLTLQGTQHVRAVATTPGSGSLLIVGTLTLGRSTSETYDSSITAAASTAITITGSVAKSTTSGGSFLYKFGGGTLYLGNATGVAFSELIASGGALDIVGSLQATLKGKRILFYAGVDPVLQANGSYTPAALGDSQNNVGWFTSTSDGGFAARSGPLTVNIASGTTLTYRTSFPPNTQAGFIASGRTLVFGSETSDNVVTLQNPLNLAGGTQTIKVVGNANPNNAAVLAGVISNGGIIKTGTGMLTLNGNNAYSGNTTVNAGTLKAGNANAFGTGSVTVNSGATLDRAGFNITNTIINNGGTVI